MSLCFLGCGLPYRELEEGENGGAAVAQGGRQGFPVLGENFFEVQAIRRKRVRKVKRSSLLFIFRGS